MSKLEIISKGNLPIPTKYSKAINILRVDPKIRCRVFVPEVKGFAKTIEYCQSFLIDGYW